MALPFRPVDVMAQARAYNLVRRGAEDGARNQPRSDADLEAEAELEVKGAIEADRQRCLLYLVSNLRAYRDALANLQTAMDVVGMRQAADEATADLGMLKVRYATELGSKREAAQARNQEYTDFRVRNRITREANQPTNRAFIWTLAVFFIVVEALANSYFFSGASEDGLLGGAFMAAIFSAVNIGIGILNGWFPCRWTRHRNLAIKLIGFTTATAIVLGSLFLNVFVAHYRDVAVMTAETPNLPALLAAVLANPFGLQGIQSWFLLGLGMAFSGIAIVKGYGLDDSYPGYGACDRHRAIATAEYEEMRHDLIDQATEIRDRFNDELRVKIETLRASSTQRQQILVARARSIVDFDTHEANLADAAQQLLSIYRRANEAARSTPVPAHFGTRFAFADKASARPAVRVMLEEQGMEIDADGLIREFETLRPRILDAYGALIEGTVV
jgi:hypothetical protein